MVRAAARALRRGTVRAASVARGRVRGPARESDVDTDTVIIGAGPYGLAISAHLSAAGVDHEIFGRPMDTWRRHMPAGMQLKSEGFASTISDPSAEHTLERYCADHARPYARIGWPVPGDLFLAYGDWFQRTLVPRVRETHVASLDPALDGFCVRLADGDVVQARRVVVATGLQHQAYVPSALQGLPETRARHTFDDPDPYAYAGQDVLVVGAGQSALEAAVLMRDAGARPTVIARTDALVWNTRPGGRNRPVHERLRHPESGLGEGRDLWRYCRFPGVFHRTPERRRVGRAYGALGPSGAWWLRSRFIGIEARTGVRVRAAASDGQRVRLDVESPAGLGSLWGDQLVCGTGYRPDVRTLPFLTPELRRRVRTAEGIPVLSATFESSVPGMHFVGFAAAGAFGPLLRFVCGTDFAARRIAAALVRRGR